MLCDRDSVMADSTSRNVIIPFLGTSVARLTRLFLLVLIGAWKGVDCTRLCTHNTHACTHKCVCTQHTNLDASAFAMVLNKQVDTLQLFTMLLKCLYASSLYNSVWLSFYANCECWSTPSPFKLLTSIHNKFFHYHLFNLPSKALPVTSNEWNNFLAFIIWPSVFNM